MTIARKLQRPVLFGYRLRNAGPLVNVQRHGVRWQLDLREGIDFAIWLSGYFEATTVHAYRRLVRDGDIVLDIGANIGAHTLHLARSAGPAGRVIAFEPSAQAAQRLATNLALNPESGANVSLQQTMLVARRDAVLPAGVVSSWPLLKRSQLDAVHPGVSQPTTGANASTLDDTLHSLDIDHVDFVKLDVDGNELDVLQGGAAMLASSAPVILFELAPSVLDRLGRRVEDVIELLTSHGYRVRSLRGAAVTSGNLTHLRRSQSSMNAVAMAAHPPT